MKYLFATVFVLLLLAAPAHSRITLLPSDDTAGGGAGDIYWFMNFGSTQTTWPVTTQCLSSTGASTAHRTCAGTPDSRIGQQYFGTPFVRYLTCAPAEEHTLWGTAASLSVAVFVYQGSDGESNFVQTQVGGSLSFDETEGTAVSKRLTINSEVPITSGMIKIKFTDVGSQPSAPIDNGLVCTIALVE